jgi:photosystem II stability/assembly factor-like uncharacterized protein
MRRELYDADAYGAVIDRLHPRTYYAAILNAYGLNTFVVSHDGGAHWSVVPLPVPASDATFMRPLQAARDPAVLVLPQRTGPMYVSTNDGQSWTVRTVDALAGDYAVRFAAGKVPHAPHPVIYVGTGSGRLWLSRDLGASWQQLDIPNPAGLSVRSIEVDTARSPGPGAEHLFVALGVDVPQEYSKGNHVGGVIESTDGGAHWTDISRPLSATSVNALLLKGSTLFAGTNNGVVQDVGGHWITAGKRFPNVRVTDLFASADGGAIFASTYGRGTLRALTPHPSARQIRKSLRKQLVPHGKAARIEALLKRGGYRRLFTALTAGHEEIRWYFIRHRRNRPPQKVLLAVGHHAFTEAGSATVKIALTKQGRRLLAHARRLKVRGTAIFIPAGGTPVTAYERFTLRRRQR